MDNLIYKDNFEDWTSVLKEYSEGYDEIDKAFTGVEEPKFVFAAYDVDGYEGDSFFIYSPDGVTFFQGGGSHCSCYGLEGQWDPTEMTFEAIQKIFTDGASYGIMNTYKKEVLSWLDGIRSQDPDENGITSHEIAGATGKIGTTMQFGTLAFIEDAMSTELEDGRSVQIYRGAMNPCYFEIKIEDEDRMLRIDIQEVMQNAVRLLVKETS